MHKVNRRQILSSFVFGCSSALLLGCGLQLRHANNLFFSTMSTNLDANSRIARKLAFKLKKTTNIILTDPKQAQVNLSILSDTAGSEVASLSAEGLIQERKLTRKISFQLLSKSGKLLIEPNTIEVSYTISFPEQLTPAKQQEQKKILQDMEDELIQLLILQLTSLKNI